MCSRAVNLLNHAFQKFVGNSNIAQRLCQMSEHLASYQPKHLVVGSVYLVCTERFSCVRCINVPLQTKKLFKWHVLVKFVKKCCCRKRNRKRKVPEFRCRRLLVVRSVPVWCCGTANTLLSLKSEEKSFLTFRANCRKQPKITKLHSADSRSESILRLANKKRSHWRCLVDVYKSTQL